MEAVVAVHEVEALADLAHVVDDVRLLVLPQRVRQALQHVRTGNTATGTEAMHFTLVPSREGLPLNSEEIYTFLFLALFFLTLSNQKKQI